jgi:hypothetical protein
VHHYKVTLVSQSRSPQLAAVRLDDESDEYYISMIFAGNTFNANDNDYFESFCRIREQLEPMGLLPRCYAAHLRAFPSGMSRSMGGGLKLYRLKLGTPTLTSDLVHMFDVDDDVVPATVADQRKFFDDWVASLK